MDQQLPPGFVSDMRQVTRSDFEQVCEGFAAMQRQTLNVIVGCASAIDELRQQVAPDIESKILPKLHRALGQLRAITQGQRPSDAGPPPTPTRQERRADEREAKKKFDALHQEKKNAKEL